jgi:geranylgeranyl pyrophosphate synthase
MKERGTFEAVSGVAKSHASRAVESLTVLPDSADRDLLDTVAWFVVEREG